MPADPLAVARELAASPRLASAPEYLRALLVVALASHDAGTAAASGPEASADDPAPTTTKRRKG